MQRLVIAVSVGLLAAVVVGPAAWLVSDRFERDNDFCTSCHLPDGTPLHERIDQDFERVIPVSLAGVHGRGWVEEREDSAFRCIDCHSGRGPVERTRVKLLAARDALRYAIGSFAEPEGMPFPLSADTCRGCHPVFRGSAAPGFSLYAYHGVAPHDGPGAPACVACHTVHRRDGDAIVYYMTRPVVDQQCLGCHTDAPAGSDERVL